MHEYDNHEVRRPVDHTHRHEYHNQAQQRRQLAQRERDEEIAVVQIQNIIDVPAFPVLLRIVEQPGLYHEVYTDGGGRDADEHRPEHAGQVVLPRRVSGNKVGDKDIQDDRGYVGQIYHEILLAYLLNLFPRRFLPRSTPGGGV